MKVYADFRQKVEVNPIDVINGLIDGVAGVNGWIIERDGKYYSVCEESAGCHSYENYEEIRQDEYEYYQALKHVLNFLKR